MCSLDWHNCMDCGAEWHCDEPDTDCPTLNGYAEQCYHCLAFSQEEEAAMWNERQNRWEDEEWQRLYGDGQ